MADYKKIKLKNGDTRFQKTISLGFEVDGRRRQKVLRAKTLKELRNLEAQYKLGIRSASLENARTFSECYDLWLVECAKENAETTIDVKRWIKKNFTPFFDRSISKIKDRDINLLMEKRSAEVQPETVRHEYSILSAFFKWCYRTHIITENPMVYTRTPKTKKKDMMYIKEDDFFTMLSAIKEPRYVLIFSLLFYCGLRKGELCGLSAPDLIDHELHLHHACKHIKNKGLVISPDLKNEQSRRIVPIPSWIEFDLAAYLGSGDYPFKKEYYHIGVALHRILEDAGLPDMRVHDMRHSYAAFLLASGVDIYTVSVLMGHASVQTTSRRYGHLYDEKRKAIAKLFEK